jgi:hypothetical protein
VTPYLLDERWLERIGIEDASIFEAWINWADSSRMTEFHRAVIAHQFLEAAQIGTSEQVSRLGWILQSLPDWPLCTGDDARGWDGRMAES